MIVAVRKLLKTGTNYVLTRKNHGDPPRLQVNIKSVSKEHAYFTVSAHSLDHVVRPSFWLSPATLTSTSHRPTSTMSQTSH